MGDLSSTWCRCELPARDARRSIRFQQRSCHGCCGRDQGLADHLPEGGGRSSTTAGDVTRSITCNRANYTGRERSHLVPAGLLFADEAEKQRGASADRDALAPRVLSRFYGGGPSAEKHRACRSRATVFQGIRVRVPRSPGPCRHDQSPTASFVRSVIQPVTLASGRRSTRSEPRRLTVASALRRPESFRRPSPSRTST